jgi:hypothetical protein
VEALRKKRDDVIRIWTDNFQLPPSCGAIFFPLSAPSPQQVTGRILAPLENRTDWLENFSVVEEKSIQMTPLPGTKESLA